MVFWEEKALCIYRLWQNYIALIRKHINPCVYTHMHANIHICVCVCVTENFHEPSIKSLIKYHKELFQPRGLLMELGYHFLPFCFGLLMLENLKGPILSHFHFHLNKKKQTSYCSTNILKRLLLTIIKFEMTVSSS